MGTWMAPWWTRGILTLVAGFVFGILPGVLNFARSLCKAQPTDWATRVRSRVSFVMVNIGWLCLAMGFAPVIAFFANLHAVYTIGYPQGYVALVPVGLTGILLSIIPDSESGAKCGLILNAVVFTLFALLGLLAAAFYGVLGSTWIPGVIMGLLFLVTGTTLSFLTYRELCGSRGARDRVLRIWQCVRILFAMLCVVSAYLLVEYMINLNAQFSEIVGFILLLLSTLIFSAITRPNWRARFCVWLSGVGVKVSDKAEAVGAAKLIWIELHEQSDAKTSPVAA